MNTAPGKADIGQRLSATIGYWLASGLTAASKAVADAITSASTTYGAEGRLRQTVINLPTPSTSTRNQLYNGVNLVADYDGADVLMRRYVHGPWC